MRKPLAGEIWRTKSGKILIVEDSDGKGPDYEKNRERMLKAGATNWSSPRFYNRRGENVAGAGLHDLIELLGMEDVSLPSTNCKHDFIRSDYTHKGAFWCRLCGEFKK